MSEEVPDLVYFTAQPDDEVRVLPHMRAIRTAPVSPLADR